MNRLKLIIGVSHHNINVTIITLRLIYPRPRSETSIGNRFWIAPCFLSRPVGLNRLSLILHHAELGLFLDLKRLGLKLLSFIVNHDMIGFKGSLDSGKRHIFVFFFNDALLLVELGHCDSLLFLFEFDYLGWGVCL